MEKLQAVAKVTKLFGPDRNGGVVLVLYDTFPEEFDPAGDPLFARIDALPVPLWCERFERRGVAGALAAFAFLSAILFGYYQLSPQDSIGITINRTEINGEKEDGSPITGFIIEFDDGSSYLVTDYFSPIYLSEGE